MAEIVVAFGVISLFAALWLAVGGSDPGAAQAPTPAATVVTPTVSTASPSQIVVTPVTNVAESTTGQLAEGGGGGSSDVGTGVIAGLAAGAAVIFAGIAYRLARGRPRAG